MLFVPNFVAIASHTYHKIHRIYIQPCHPYTYILLHVSAINLLPQGDINKKEYKINTFT